MTAQSRLPSEQRINPEDAQRSQRIRQGIMDAGDALRARHPWLVKHQDAIGMTIFAVSIAGIFANAFAYYLGAIAWYVAIPVAALWMSLLHELEHDLIHSMYFRKSKFWNNFMMLGVWIMRPSTINPFVRKRLHIHHHKFSGTESDIEERGITNGTPWGLKRLLMVSDNMWSVALRPLETVKMMKAFIKAQAPKTAEEKHKIVRENLLSYLPLGAIHYTLWYSFLIYHIAGFGLQTVGIEIAVPALVQHAMHVIDFLAVVYLAPNMLRTFCIHFVSSNMHYYGEVELGNIVQQCQVWTSPWTWPVQLFCFNFAGTHAIHHFVVRDPFYIRQAMASGLYPLLRENGVRFNDFGSFKRANRLYATSLTAPAPTRATATV